LEVLNGIIGKERREKDIPQISALPDRPTELVEAINFDGLSLEEFVAKADPTSTRKARGGDINARTIQQFEQERDKFEELHTSITGCDDVSKSVELYLNDFQTELGAVSAEIETLQTRSTQLNAMLENRRNVEKLLGPAVEEISISPKAVRTIAEGPMDENWVRALNEIDARTTSIEAKASSSNGFKAIDDVRPLLIDLKNKVSNGQEKAFGLQLTMRQAIERIRDYLVSQIRAMRSPNINSQIIQQQRLVRFKDLYSYLSKVHPKLAGEISQAYINTMRWYYNSNFTRYLQALDKIKVYPSDRNEVLGGDSSSHRSGWSPYQNYLGTHTDDRQEIFFLAAEPALPHMILSRWVDVLISSELETNRHCPRIWPRKTTHIMGSKHHSEISTLPWWTTYLPSILS
jgi:hypothetical protein